MGDKPLTKKILEEILDMKLMPLKARIDDLTDKMKDFRTFIDEANRNYEATNMRMSKMQEEYGILSNESRILKDTIRELDGKVSALKKICNELEQYSRREYAEIQGIPLPPRGKREDTHKIVIKVGDLMGVDINANDFSVSHRLPISQKYKGKRSLLPSIIVKFVRRDTKELFYRAPKKLKDFTTHDLGYPDGNNIFISESLTEVNKALVKAALKAKKDHDYDFIWTSNGKIYLREDSDSRAIYIKNEDDLLKL